MNEETKIKECNANDTKQPNRRLPQLIYVYINIWHIYYAFVACKCVFACVRVCVVCVCSSYIVISYT